MNRQFSFVPCKFEKTVLYVNAASDGPYLRYFTDSLTGDHAQVREAKEIRPGVWRRQRKLSQIVKQVVRKTLRVL